MKIIKFKKKINYKSKRKVIIKNLIINMFIGIHAFEKRKRQRVKFNITITTDSKIEPNRKKLSTILDYEKVIKNLKLLVEKRHYDLLEDLSESIFEMIFDNKLVKKINLKLEKLDIIKDADSVGIEVSKIKNE
tara:strand:- start:14650 stop:15048 length:399 start_codon:yes stop_codon:yes gene_type:complete